MSTSQTTPISGISVMPHPDARPIDPYNPKVPDVKNAFHAIVTSGTRHKYWGMPQVFDPLEAHVQGVAPYDNYLLVTHNEALFQSQGYLLVINRDTQMLVQQNLTPNPGFSHPGGCQRIGSYLVMALENASYDESYIRFYDLSPMSDKVPPTLLPYYKHRSDRGAGGVGITNYTDADGKERYVMAVFDNNKVDLYQSNPVGLGDPTLTFMEVASGLPTGVDYSTVCLVTDTRQNLWMLGFTTEDLGTWNQDYAYLSSVSLSPPAVTAIGRRHLITDHGNLPVAFGVHFRYAAGMQVRGDLSLEIFATQRNFYEGEFYSNTFRQETGMVTG